MRGVTTEREVYVLPNPLSGDGIVRRENDIGRDSDVC
jgi:hypothetical protein